MEGVNDKVEVFRTYNNVFEANVVKELLASQGIPSMIKDEQTIGLMPFFGTLGGTKLFLRKCDFERAVKIIDEAESSELPENIAD